MKHADDMLTKRGKLRGPSTPFHTEQVLNRASGGSDVDDGDGPMQRAAEILNRARKINLSAVGADETGATVFSPGVGALSGRGRAASSLQAYANRSTGTTSITPSEQRLLDRDESIHEVKKGRSSDQDAARLPMYLPHDGIASKIFHDVVQKYLDQGMDYKSAWLAAKANNPVAFRAYSA